MFSIIASLFPVPAEAAAGVNKTLNIQGRLLNNTGAVIPDGIYNMEFKIYQDGPGNVANDTGGTLKWTEDWLRFNSQGVTVKNGYCSISLGSVTAFGGSIGFERLALLMEEQGKKTSAAASPEVFFLLSDEALRAKIFTLAG